ncbi:MAG: M15 family metallopeptidase [Chryseolinea sp.]
MRLLSLLVPGALSLLTFSSLQAQDDVRFSPFDCREHSEEQAMPESDHGLAQGVSASLLEQFVPPEAVLVLDTAEGWKHWTYVENYAFGKDRGDLAMISDLNALHPVFRDKISNLIIACRAKGIELAIVETYRTHAKQHEYKTMGKKYTYSSAGKSKHQYGLAIDVVPVVNGSAVWDNTFLWKKVGMVGEKFGLRWGGRWKKPYDPGHFEWTGGLATSSLHTGVFPVVHDAEQHYPCLDEDIRTLRRYWSEWELSQSSITRK